MAEERIQIEIQNEGLEALVRVVAGEALEADAVAAALAEAGVHFGIDEAVKNRIEGRIHEPEFELTEQTIARGEPPQAGRDGGIELAVEVGTVAYTRRADGTFDWMERNTLVAVHEGDDLGALRDPTDGRAGTDVEGEEIPATPGQPAEPALGDGIQLDEQGRLVATRSGALFVRNANQLDVLDSVEHTGDVDMASGHLRTDGSLCVTGSVNPHFEVKAEGDLIVKGNVFGAVVEAGGQVNVGRGIQGGEHGLVEAGGDLFAQRAEMATLRSGGAAVFATDLVGSQITARSIEVGKRILGGVATAESRIQTLDAGAASGAGTKLRVAEPFASPREEARRKAVLHSERRSLSRGGGGRDAGRHARKKTGKKARARVAIDRKDTAATQDRVAQRRQLMETAEVCVLGTANPGVRICFGSRRVDVDDPVRATRFAFDREKKRIVATEL